MAADRWRDLEELLGRERRDQLIRLGAEHGESGLAAILAAHEAGDRAGFRTEAHRLRGALDPLGADEATALLARIDMGEDATALLEPLTRALRSFVAECRHVVAG